MMMARRDIRVRIDNDGRIEVIDPGFDSLPLPRAIDPGFRIRRESLPGFTTPRFLRLRNTGCSIRTERLAGYPEDVLWDIHNVLMRQMRETKMLPIRHRQEASVLDLKTEIAERILSECRLCGHRCGVNRLRGEEGLCRLGREAIVSEHFIHIAEEAPVNPSLMLSLAGCGLRCRFCRQGTLLDPALAGDDLGPSLWSDLQWKGARSLFFTGGNPDGSLHAVLRFLASAPPDWKLPIVWNSNAYATPETMKLLEGVADVYIPAFKYGNEACGRALSQAPNYPAVAQRSLSAMLTQGVPVIVRILVLPNHLECCHLPVIRFLASVNSERLFVSVRGQYGPDGLITQRNGPPARRVTSEEVEAVCETALHMGLKRITR